MPVSIDQIDQCLPQTQCTKCGYPGCREYAEAIAGGEAGINQCPPGGETTIAALASLLETEHRALDPEFGTHAPRKVARVIEPDCIGCTLCIKACPVDAILGASKMMHTVIESECTGCELCLPPCPMDCIDLVKPVTVHKSGPWDEYSLQCANRARARRQQRLARKSELQARNRSATGSGLDRKTLIRQALERSRARRG